MLCESSQYEYKREKFRDYNGQTEGRRVHPHEKSVTDYEDKTAVSSPTTMTTKTTKTTTQTFCNTFTIEINTDIVTLVEFYFVNIYRQVLSSIAFGFLR